MLTLSLKAFAEDFEYLKALKNHEMARTFLFNTPFPSLPPYDPSTWKVASDLTLSDDDFVAPFVAPLNSVEVNRAIESLSKLKDSPRRTDLLTALLHTPSVEVQVPRYYLYDIP